MDSDIANVLNSLRLELSETQVHQLGLYMDWLASEATVGGAIGPHEHSRLANRHIADSLLYLQVGFEPEDILDIGAGAGLPGLVLAIARPQTPVTLVDRSSRRVGLMRRAVRVVGLENVNIVEADIERDPTLSGDLVTMRAVFPPARALPVMIKHCRAGAVLGLSRQEEPGGIGELEAVARAAGFSLVLTKSEVLEPASWMLIMART